MRTKPEMKKIKKIYRKFWLKFKKIEIIDQIIRKIFEILS